MSQKASGFERQAADQYMTPEWAVRSLLSVEPIWGEVWEPACGEGAIFRVIAEHGDHTEVLGTDILPTDGGPPIDFLTLDHTALFNPRQHLTIITNPPYGKQGRLALAFVNRAMELTKPVRGKVIMLLPVDWDSAKGRAHLFADFPGHIRKIVLTERIRWTNLPQSKSGPSQNHAWFIWDWSRRGSAMNWIGKVDEPRSPDTALPGTGGNSDQ